MNKKTYINPEFQVINTYPCEQLLLSSGKDVVIPQGAKESIFNEETDYEY